MNVDVADYRALHAKLRAAEPRLRRAFNRRLKEAGQPLADRIVAEGPEGQPSGLVGWYSGRSRARLAATSTGVRMVISAGKNVARVDQTGLHRHPVFGNRKHWATTQGVAGTWSKVWESGADEVASQVSKALDELGSML